MENSLTFNTHPLEETIEEYCFNRLSDENTAALEEHLLLCETCQHRLESLDEYISVMKAVTAQYDVASPKTSTEGIWSRWRDAWSRPFQPGWAMALESLAAVAILSWATIATVTARRIETPRLSASVMLTAVRGGASLASNQAPAGRTLNLAIDLADLPSFNAYRVEVVSAQGERVWETQAKASNGKLSARFPQGLTTGMYWVRLYPAQGELLREFGLRVQ